MEWISVKDQLPEERVIVVLKRSGKKNSIKGYLSSGYFFRRTGIVSIVKYEDVEAWKPQSKKTDNN